MTINLDLEWKTDLPDIRVLVVGDVRDVIHSRAGRVSPVVTNSFVGAANLPESAYGFGAFSPGGPELSGEGMIWRGRAGATLPLEEPQVVTGPIDRFSTPFFLGWNGDPAAQGSFTAEGSSLRLLYERLFEEMQAAYPAQAKPLLLVEILGAVQTARIHGRALKRPVHEGDRLVTNRPEEYFNFHIIQNDLKRSGHPLDGSLDLAIVGAGYRPGGDPAILEFEQKVFYESPRLEGGPSLPTSPGAGGIKTHSHVMAWREGHSTASAPDYILHLDEWSEVAGGSLRVFAASPGMIEFVSA